MPFLEARRGRQGMLCRQWLRPPNLLASSNSLVPVSWWRRRVSVRVTSCRPRSGERATASMLLWAIAVGALLQVRAERGHCAVAAGHGPDRGGRLGGVPSEMGEGVLRPLPRALDCRRQRGPDQCHRAGNCQPHGWDDSAVLGRCCPQPDRRGARLGGWLRALREADEGAGRHHGLQHPDLRRAHHDRSLDRLCGVCWCRPFHRTAAATCCR